MLIKELKKLIWFSELTDIELAESNLNKIKFSSFNKVFSSDYSIKTISSCYSTAVEYIKALNYLTTCVENNETINQYKIHFVSKSVLLLDFYHVKNNYYSPVNLTQDFIKEAKRFLVTFNNVSNKTDRTLYDDRFIRLTEHFVKDILDISKELLNVD